MGVLAGYPIKDLQYDSVRAVHKPYIILAYGLLQLAHLLLRCCSPDNASLCSASAVLKGIQEVLTWHRRLITVWQGHWILYLHPKILYMDPIGDINFPILEL